MSVRKVTTLFLFLVCARLVGAQTVSLSELSVESRGSIADGDSRAIFATAARLALWFIPADWVRVRGRAYMYIQDTEAFLWRLDGDTDPGFLLFDGAEVVFPEIRENHVSITLFTGFLDNPASGTFLRESLKARVDDPEFYGMPAGMAFAPTTEIRGTGCAATVVPASSSVAAAGYAYWNERSGNDAAFTVDARIAADGNTASVNAFSGAYVRPVTQDVAFRAGATALFRSESGHELYAGVGFKGVKASLEDLERNLYLLFEPRLHLGMTDFIILLIAGLSADERGRESGRGGGLLSRAQPARRLRSSEGKRHQGGYKHARLHQSRRHVGGQSLLVFRQPVREFSCFGLRVSVDGGNQSVAS